MTLEEQFARLVKTLQLIEAEPWQWDAARLELEFGVGRATVERDIRILRQWGTIERKEGYFAVRNLSLLPTPFSPSEALALVLAGNTMVESIGMPPSDALCSALRKIDLMLPNDVDELIRKMSRRVSVGVNMIRECDSEVLDDVSRAISNHSPIEISYYVFSRNELTKRKIDPYGLTFKFGDWYIIGYCHLRQCVRTFGVDRVRALKVLDERFEYPSDFDLKEYLERGWSLQSDAPQENVVLRFDKEVALWIAGCKFHPTQKTELQADGSLLFEVTIAGVGEITHWILGFGDRVEVLKPEILREGIALTVSHMAKRYSG